jgi:hypothetical protein
MKCCCKLPEYGDMYGLSDRKNTSIVELYNLSVLSQFYCFVMHGMNSVKMWFVSLLFSLVGGWLIFHWMIALPHETNCVMLYTFLIWTLYFEFPRLLGRGVWSLDDWCLTFRDCLLVSSSRPEMSMNLSHILFLG